MDDTTKNTIFEVAVKTEGDRVPVRLMNAEQALALPDDLDVKISHPEREAGDGDLYQSRRAQGSH